MRSSGELEMLASED